MTYGRLVPDADGASLLFERFLPHPRARVWAALTDPEQRAAWFFAGVLEPRVGGRVDLEDSGPGVHGQVVAVEPEVLLTFTWDSEDGPDSSVSFALSDAPGGTVLRFTHRIDDRCRPENLLPGWHAIFDDLGPYLDDGQVVEHPGRHAQLLADYAQRAGGVPGSAPA